MASGFIVPHPPTASTTLSDPLLRTIPLFGLWTVCLPNLFRGSYSLCLYFVLIANIWSSESWHGPDFCRIRRYVLAGRRTGFVLPQFFLCGYNIFLHFFHKTCSFIFFFFLFEERFQFVTKLIPVPIFFLSSVAAFSSMSYRSASLFVLLCRYSTTYFAFLSSLRRALCSSQWPQSTFL